MSKVSAKNLPVFPLPPHYFSQKWFGADLRALVIDSCTTEPSPWMFGCTFEQCFLFWWGDVQAHILLEPQPLKRKITYSQACWQMRFCPWETSPRRVALPQPAMLRAGHRRLARQCAMHTREGCVLDARHGRWHAFGCGFVQSQR